MNTSKKSLLLAFAFTAALAGSAVAQQTLGGAPKDQTDPSAAVRNEVRRDHAASFGHTDVMMMRSKASAPAPVLGTQRSALAGAPKDQTDPDAAVRNEVQREHFRSFGHTDVMVAPTAPVRGVGGRNVAAPTITYGQVAPTTDPDARIQSTLRRDVYIR